MTESEYCGVGVVEKRFGVLGVWLWLEALPAPRAGDGVAGSFCVVYTMTAVSLRVGGRSTPSVCRIRSCSSLAKFDSRISS